MGSRVILVVLFDERSSLGLVRLRVQKASDRADRRVRGHGEEERRPATAVVFAEITDDDIDNLFND